MVWRDGRASAKFAELMIQRYEDWFSAILILACLVYFVTVAFVGSYSRYLADDYCTAGIFLSNGLIGAQKYWYTHWSGRYSFYFAVDVAEFGGVELVPFLPLGTLLVWWLTVGWFIYQAGRLRKWSSPIIRAVAWSGLIIYAALDGTPDIVQSLYWRTGMLTYIAPLIVLTGYFGLLLYQSRRFQSATTWPWMSLSFLLTFVAAGFSETFAVVQTLLLCYVFIGCFAMGATTLKKNLLPTIVVGLLGSVVGMIVMFIAPGNQFRQAYFSEPSLILAVPLAVRFTIVYLQQIVLSLPLMITLVISIFWGLRVQPTSNLPPRSQNIIRLSLALLPLMAFFLTLASFLPAAWGMSVSLPTRAIIIPQFILTCFIAVWGYLIGFLLTQSVFVKAHLNSRYFVGVSAVTMVVLIILGPISATSNTLALAPPARSLAEFWDTRHELIQAAKATGTMDLEVPILPYSASLEDIGPDPNHWVNNCVAQYYGIQSIVAR